MICAEYVVTVFNYLAHGVVTGYTTANNYVPFQIIAIVRNNGVSVSRFTITNISFVDKLINSNNERIVVTMIGTDASNYSYTATCIEIWASTQNALLYKIADISLTTPLCKSELDYLQVEYKVTVCVGSAYIITPQLSQYAPVISVSVPTSPLLFFFGLFLVPNFINILKQNPTYPLSQLLPYINLNSFPGINVIYVNGEEATLISNLVGFGNDQVSLVTNFQVSTTYTNPIVVVGVYTGKGVLPVTYGLFSGSISQYGSVKITASYGTPTVKYFTETKTTGG